MDGLDHRVPWGEIRRVGNRGRISPHAACGGGGIGGSGSSDQASALLKALAEPLRLRVIEALGEGERCVCDLTAELGLAQSKLSFHLKVLREAGLIDGRQQGRWMYYRLRPDALEFLQQWLARLALRCTTLAQECDLSLPERPGEPVVNGLWIPDAPDSAPLPTS
jgi:ArsR family transcriptional regulator